MSRVFLDQVVRCLPDGRMFCGILLLVQQGVASLLIAQRRDIKRIH